MIGETSNAHSALHCSGSPLSDAFSSWTNTEAVVDDASNTAASLKIDPVGQDYHCLFGQLSSYRRHHHYRLLLTVLMRLHSSDPNESVLYCLLSHSGHLRIFAVTIKLCPITENELTKVTSFFYRSISQSCDDRCDTRACIARSITFCLLMGLTRPERERGDKMIKRCSFAEKKGEEWGKHSQLALLFRSSSRVSDFVCNVLTAAQSLKQSHSFSPLADTRQFVCSSSDH